MKHNTSSRSLLLVTALLVTWLAWGASFAAIAFALHALPPLLLMATRFIVAGAIATSIGAWLDTRNAAPRTTLRQWHDAAIVGAGFIAVGMGVTSWAATRLPTNVTALLVATAPLWLVALQLVTTRERVLNTWVVLGVLAGALGVVVLMTPSSGTPAIDVRAALVLVVANGVWAATSLFARTASRPRSLLKWVGMQMLVGGALLSVASAASGELGRMHLDQVGQLVAGSWLYLVLASSLGGFLAYGWLLEHVSMTTASTHAFVNPLVAVAIGAALLGEAIDAHVLVAALAIVTAVVLLLVGEARRRVHPRVHPPVRHATSVRRTRVPQRPLGWSPAPTPSFAARRSTRPLHATDGMDALDIDRALDTFGA